MKLEQLKDIITKLTKLTDEHKISWSIDNNFIIRGITNFPSNYPNIQLNIMTGEFMISNKSHILSYVNNLNLLENYKDLKTSIHKYFESDDFESDLTEYIDNITNMLEK